MRKLITCILAIAFAASTAAADDHFSLAVDSSDNVWMARCADDDVVLSVWDQTGWRETARHAAPGCKSIALASTLDGVAAAWIEGRGVAIALSGSDRIHRPEQLRGASEVAAAALPGGEIGLLVADSATLRWAELDVSTGELLAARALPAEGRISSLSVAVAADRTWLAWQEKTDAAMFISVANPPGTERQQYHRFRVKGFAAAAEPVLTAGKQGAQLVWQGTRDKYYSVLRARALSDDGLGPIQTIKPPEGVSGMLSPKAFAGNKAGVSAYGWGNGGWRALRVDVGETAEASLRSDNTANLAYPQLAVDAEGGELWVAAAAAEPLVRTQKQLSSVLPADDPAPEPIEGVTYALAFGDSITYGKDLDPYTDEEIETDGYTNYLANKYTKKVRQMEVIKSGFPGENTAVADWEDPGEVASQGLVRLPGELDKYSYAKFVLILEGTNDARRNMLTAEEIAENLGLMIDMVRDAGMVPVVATLLPRFDSSLAVRAQAEDVSEAIRPMAQLRGVTLCDFQEDFPKNPNLFYDLRLHPDQEGYEKMAEIWLETLLTFEGDVDRSFKIDEEDLRILASSLRSRRGSFAFNPDADFNDDGVIDVKDLSFLLNAYGLKF